MNLREALRIAMRGLRANRLRSALTMLGIIIGVSAVILLVAIGNGVQSSVNERIEPLANLITIKPTEGNVPGGTAPKDLIDADIAALQKREQAPDIATVIPVATGPTLAETDTLKFRTNVVGSTERWLDVNNQDFRRGLSSTRPRSAPPPRWWSWALPSRPACSVTPRRPCARQSGSTVRISPSSG